MEQTKANTDVSEFKIIDDEKNTPTLEEAQAFVGGYVECITFPNGDVLIVNMLTSGTPFLYIYITIKEKVQILDWAWYLY